MIQIFSILENIGQLELVVNNEIKYISEWFKNNQLTLNIKKTNYIVLNPRKRNLNMK